MRDIDRFLPDPQDWRGPRDALDDPDGMFSTFYDAMAQGPLLALLNTLAPDDPRINLVLRVLHYEPNRLVDPYDFIRLLDDGDPILTFIRGLPD